MEKKVRFYKTIIFLIAGLIVLSVINGKILLGMNEKEEKIIVTADTNDVIRGNNRFALELYTKLAQEKKNENLFFSPYSISTALAMTYAGAKGNTEKQMADVLHFELPQDKLHPAFASLEKRLNEGGKKGVYELNVANALWGQKGYKFLDSFIEQVNKNYSAGLNEVDFKKDAEGTRQTINKWIENKTKDKIREPIKPGILNELTRLVLTNAIYFRGKWAIEFDKKDTKDAPFHITATKETNVQMMYIKKHFKYADVGNLQVLELPYKGGDLSMVVLLPKEVNGIDELEKSLTLDNLAKWIGKSFKLEVGVHLPKFKMTSEFSLGEVLSQMGMQDAFSLPPADFSGMTEGKELFISAVIHKAFVEVNEEGTEATAATAIVIATSMQREQPVFWADHPFIFLIRDNKTGSILFMGKVMNPVEK
jgi:serpin B